MRSSLFGSKDSMKRFFQIIEVPILVVVPIALLLCAFLNITQSAFLGFIVVVAALVIFFAAFENSKPALRQIMPSVVLGALAAAGRILFVAIADFKPVSAIAIIAGTVFGRQSGFMVGALAALVSNFFFGQGVFTPWQMYAWGMVGYCAGILADKGFFENQIVLYSYGFLSSIAYGLLLNSWYIVGFVQPLTWETALIAYGVGLPFDAIQGGATVFFLMILYTPWRRKLSRIRQKYALR